VISFDRVVQALPHDMTGTRQQVVEYSWVGGWALMRASGSAMGQTRARPLAGEHCMALDPEPC